MLFKNALFDESKSVFSGLIKVDPNAQNTDSFQTNRNLLLSSQSEADSLPGLQILANDVKCSHGATTSKIDDQELFYLQSRGISQKLSEKLIVLGFFEEIISRTNSDDITDLLRNEVSNFYQCLNTMNNNQEEAKLLRDVTATYTSWRRIYSF